jgi:hypothetical protein
MLRAIVVVLVALTSEVAAESEAKRVDEMAGALPELAKIERGRARVTVRGTVASKKQREVVAVADQVVADVARRFTSADGDAHREIRLLLLPTNEQYREAASAFDDTPSDWGFYRPDLRVAIANLGASIGNLRHELVHPLIGDDFPRIPAWLNEGIAALYGTAKWNGKRFEFLVNYRLRDLQKAIADGSVPTIDELAKSTDADVRGKRAMVFYAMSRYVLLFVEKQGKLSSLYSELRAAKLADHGKILASYVDDDTFIAWAKKLRR